MKILYILFIGTPANEEDVNKQILNLDLRTTNNENSSSSKEEIESSTD